MSAQVDNVEESVKVDGQPLAISMLKMRSEEEQGGKPMNYAGLNILRELDGLLVQQEWGILETLSLWYEQKNEYTIYDSEGKVKLFLAKEKTSCCFRICCGENRPFRIKVYDHTGKKDKAALVFKRKYRCCGCAIFPCCAHKVDVHYMVDQNNNEVGKENSRTLISTVEVPKCHGGCLRPTWRVKDRRGGVQANIKGPCCCVCDCCGAEFDVTDKHGNETGKIRKLRPDGLKGLAKEIVTDADNFQLKFDKGLDPTIKMAMIAATLQIDFTFFEDKRGCLECRLCDCWCCGWACPCLPACLAAVVCCCCMKDKKKDKEEKKNQGAPAAEAMTR